jgi:hypothetical protein
MSPALLAWSRALDADGRPKVAGFFQVIAGWKPERLELAAWARWMHLSCNRNGEKLDREVQRVMLDPGQGAA